MTGTIQGGSLAELLRELIVARKSGLLFLRSGPSEKGLYLASGAIVNTESNVADDGLAYRLLDLDLVTPQGLEAALREVEPGRSLADVLRESGNIGDERLATVQKSLCEQIAVSVFDWTEGSFFFQEGDFSFKGGHELNTPALMLEGVRRMFEFEDTKRRLLEDPRPLRPLVTGRGRLNLEPTEGFIFSRVDGSLSAAEICALSIISEEMTCRVLYGLMVAGVIEPGELRSAETARSATGPIPRPVAAPRAATGPAPRPPEASRPSPAQPPRPSSDATNERTATGARARVEVSHPGATGTTGDGRPRVERWTPEGGTVSPGAPPRPAATGARPQPQAPAGRLEPWQQERAREIDQMLASLDSLNHYAALGLPRDARMASVDEAFQSLSERFHPARNAWITDDALRQRLVVLFAKLRNAHQTLVNDRSRIEYDEQLRRHDKEAGADVNIRMEFSKTDRQKAIEERVKESEQLYREASKLFEAQRFHDARTKALKAIDIHPEEPKYYALAGRIEMLNPNLRWQKDAENHLRRAIELDRWNPEYRVSLGLLYKNAGMRTKAKREFIKALELDAANATALAEVPPAERPAPRPPDMGPPPETDEPEVDWS